MNCKLIKNIAVLLVVALLSTSAGCSERGASPETETSKPESGNVQVSSELEEASSFAPALDLVNDTALHRDILVNYGADITTGNNNIPLEAHQGASLFLREDWDSKHPMEGFAYFAWNFGQMWNEGITNEERQTKYAHPSGKDNMGWFFPQTLYEERAQQYFDVSIDTLRSIMEYDSKNEGYHMQAGFGMGGKVQVALRSVKLEKDVLELSLTLIYEGVEPARNEDKILRVRMMADGSYKYIAYVTEGGGSSDQTTSESSRPDTSPSLAVQEKTQSDLTSVDSSLTPEQKTALEQQAVDFALHFPVTFGSTAELDPYRVAWYTFWQMYEQDPDAVNAQGYLILDKAEVDTYAQQRFGIAEIRYSQEIPSFDEATQSYSFMPLGEAPRLELEMGRTTISEDGTAEYLLTLYHQAMGQEMPHRTFLGNFRYRFKVCVKDGQTYLQAISCTN